MPEKTIDSEVKKESKIEFKGEYFAGVGSRKRAVARVRLYSGKGKFYINNKEISKVDEEILLPLTSSGQLGKFDVSVNVIGGGKIGQKAAIVHGIARALVEFNKDLKTTLRKAGYITRDPREKERKKPGLRRARRAPQWQKR